jgi:hypothetical protein
MPLERTAQPEDTLALAQLAIAYGGKNIAPT